jgi:two-component system NtrC family response regulator
MNEQTKIRLLIVDDEERFLRTITSRLSLRNFDVTAVTSGREALKEAEQRPFDIVLLDLKMPGMAGEEVLESLKESHPLLEVVILTGHGSIDSAVQCTRLGSHSYLQKPCDTEELLRVLKDAYTRRVQRKLQIDEQRLQQLLGAVEGESPLGILRRLRDLETGGAMEESQ